MEKLIEAYSIQDIFLFLITFALAIKGLVSFYDWGHDRLKKAFKKAEKVESVQCQIEEHRYEYETLKMNQSRLEEKLEQLHERLELLIASDKADIKSFITDKHHFYCYEQGWIDDYSMDCIERRYSHYVDEGGNSFIKDLMKELRELPKQSPQ